MQRGKSDGIWDGDLFDRALEAEQLHAYIQSIAARTPIREDKQSFTISVEGRYGQGKTYFLKRFARYLSNAHPVAYCDAWADDFTDEPLTALAATLKDALGQFHDKEKVETFLTKTGTVTKIVSRGLLRRGAGLLITDSAVAALDALNVNIDEAIEDATEKIGEGIADDAASTRFENTARKIMLDRIAQFKKGRSAIDEVKKSLRSIISSLEHSKLKPPIVIIVDELDRCRPDYAISLLEQIKHLFDVPGVIFVLGMNSEQLGHSISGLYGSNFDGHSYLKRFIDRSYRMREARLEKLLKVLIRRTSLRGDHFYVPPMSLDDTNRSRFYMETFLPLFISEMMNHYGLGARESFSIIDMLETGAALTEGHPINLAYYLPLAIGLLQGLEPGAFPKPRNPTTWRYLMRPSRRINNGDPVSPDEYLSLLQGHLESSAEALSKSASLTSATEVLRDAARAKPTGYKSPPLWAGASYPRLLQTVARFSSPET